MSNWSTEAPTTAAGMDTISPIPAVQSALNNPSTDMASGKRVEAMSTLRGQFLFLAGAVFLAPLGPAFSRPDAPGEGGSVFEPKPINFLGGNNDVFSLAVSPDGRQLAAASGYWDRTGEVKLWDLSTRRLLKTFRTWGGQASVAFSPDGRQLASAGYDFHVHVWDLKKGWEVMTLDWGGQGRAAFSPDGKLIATATEDNKSVKLWDASSGKELAALQGDLFRFHCAVFSRDGKLLAAGGGDWDGKGPSQVTLWDVKTMKQVGKLLSPQPVLNVAFSPDGLTIATGGLDGAVKLWDSATFKERASYAGHTRWVEGLAFAPDGRDVGQHESRRDGTNMGPRQRR